MNAVTVSQHLPLGHRPRPRVSGEQNVDTCGRRQLRGDAGAQLSLPIFDGAEVHDGGGAEPRRTTAPPAGGPGDDSVTLVAAAKRPTTRDRRPVPKQREPLDPVDTMLRDFARALIATAIHVHDDMAASGFAPMAKPQRAQGKARVLRATLAGPDVVPSVPRNDSGAAPLATADPVVPNRCRRLET